MSLQLFRRTNVPAGTPRAGSAGAGLARTGAPIALTGLVTLAMSITDALLMADIDPRALTTGMIIGDVTSLAMQFAAGALGAVAAPVAAAHAAGDLRKVGRTIADGLRLALVLAIVGAAGIVFVPHALLALGVDLPLPGAAKEYAAFSAAVFAVMMIVSLARTIFPAFGSGWIVLIVILSAVPLNLVADLVLMHGWFGLPAMGLAGAGAASLVVAIFMAATLLITMCLHQRFRQTGVWQSLPILPPTFVSFGLGKAALFTGAALLTETGVYLSSTLVIAFIAIEAVPSHILVFRLVAILYVIGSGFAQAITIHMARSQAMQDSHAEAALQKAAMIGMACLAVAFLGLMLALPSAGARLGFDTSLVGHLTPWAAIAVCNLIPVGIAFGILKARADVAMPSAICLAGYWGVGFTLMLTLSGPLGFGAAGVWAGLAIGTTATAAGSWIYLHRRERHWLTAATAGRIA
jgi:MATE family multidrug resistance protein